MEHLALEVFDLTGSGSQFATLPPNTVIHIRRTSQIFGSGAVFSQEFTLNIPANAHLFGSAGDIHGSRLHEQMNKRKARIWAEGLPLYLGYLRLADEVDVDEDGNVGVTFESGQKTFEEMIEGAKANQVPMMGDVRFGVALWRKRWVCVSAKLEASAKFKTKAMSGRDTSDPTVITHKVLPTIVGDEDPQLTFFMYDGEKEGNSVQQYPRMVFPKGKFDNLKTGEDDEEIDCLNTDYPYDDAHPYCNVALCYQKSGYTVTKEENGTKTTYDEYSSEPTAQRGYEVMPANRVNSAPNFFVIYWVRALMKHLGIYVEENQMMDVEDLRRLFFVNTNCAYKEVKKLRNPQEYDWSLGRYQFGSGGNLVAEYFGDLKNEKYGNDKPTKRYDGLKNITKIEDCGLECKGFTAGRWYETVTGTDQFGNIITHNVDVTSMIPEIDHIDIKIKEIAGMSETVRAYYDGINGQNKGIAKNIFLHDAIATSECFPNVDISEVVSALESGFGVRLLFSEDYQRVRIVLLRNIFRSTEVQNIQCDIVGEPTKTENSIRGFRMTYGDSEDTHFYYKGFADKLPHKKPYFVDDTDKHDYSYWKVGAKYEDLLDKVSAFDKTCYVDNWTGDAYVIKVDKDAKRYDELHPSLFGCADFMDAEDGDCTGEDETIKTVNVGFTPAIMNDVNYENQRGENRTKNQRFALFVDETMRPRRPDLQDGKDYNDSDAVYSVEKLYELHGPSGSGKKMVSDSVVQPGSFAITSDMYAERTGLSTVLAFMYNITIDGGAIFPTWHYATCQVANLHIAGHINEGYRLYLQDNFEPNDDGISPIETKDWGLTLGIMRGSGSGAYVNYTADSDDGEGNDTWDIMAGSSATAHPDTCDNYGNEWDYNGSVAIVGTSETVSKMVELWPNSNISLIYSSGTTLRNESNYISGAAIRSAKDYYGNPVNLLFATTTGTSSQKTYSGDLDEYARRFNGIPRKQMYTADAGMWKILIEVGSTDGRKNTLLDLQRRAFLLHDTSKMVLDDNGVGSRYGRFSLKLRAEKLNPYFDPKQAESSSNRRYLEITNDNLKGRGLCDQFYKEYSYWVRNARIVNLPVRMELAQLLTIDDTVRATVGDVTGFINEMEYDISMETGLGNVTMQMMYI